MATWSVIPAITRLRSEFNAIAPDRARGADGTIGDLAHQQSVSDHNPDETGAVPIHDADNVNEVHALDITTDLRTPGLSMEAVVQFLLARCRSGAERRLRYIIFNRRIWSASSGWVQKAYTLTDPHTGHAHFSFSYTTDLEANTASFHLEDLVALNSTDLTKIENIVKKYVGDVVQRYDEEGKPIVGAENNPTMGAASALGYLGRDMITVKQALAGLQASEDLTSQVFTQALTAAAPAIAAAVVALLPANHDDVTVDDLTAAFVHGTRELMAKPG
jgi:hypothetical protein